MTEGKGTENQANRTVAPEIPLPGNMPATGAASEVSLEEEVAAMKPRLSKKRDRMVNDGADANAPPKVLRKDYASVRPEQSTRRWKFLQTLGLAAGSTFVTPADTKGVNDRDSLSFAEPQPHPEQSMTQDIYQPRWGVTNSCRLDTPNACQDVIDHIVPPTYCSELRRMSNAEFLSQYNKNLAQQEEEIKKFDQEIQGLQNPTGNLKTLLEAEADMKKATETKNADLTKELESLHTYCLRGVKKYEDDRVERRYAEIDARLDALSIDVNEELYPHVLTAIAGRRWVIGHGLRLAVMKCVESIELRQAFANVVSAGIAKGMSEGLAHDIELGKAKSDSEEDAPKWICDLRPSTSQLKIHVYLEVRDPRDPWAIKEEMLLEEAIAANVSRGKKKKRCRWSCDPTADAATYIEASEDVGSPRLLKSKSLSPMYNLDWL
nr:hypothetical protein [Tanacetum cinerariifolium]